MELCIKMMMENTTHFFIDILNIHRPLFNCDFHPFPTTKKHHFFWYNIVTIIFQPINISNQPQYSVLTMNMRLHSIRSLKTLNWGEWKPTFFYPEPNQLPLNLVHTLIKQIINFFFWKITIIHHRYMFCVYLIILSWCVLCAW